MDYNFLILARMEVILNHMILRDAHDAGLISDSDWEQFLINQLKVRIMEDNDGE